MELSFSFFFFLFFFGSDIRNWIRNIEQHASDNVNKILVGNKADMDESKRVGVLWLINSQQMLHFHPVGWILSSLMEHATACINDTLYWIKCNHPKSMREGWIVDEYATL
jgi:GTPase SAR1 family protein